MWSNVVSFAVMIFAGVLFSLSQLQVTQMKELMKAEEGKLKIAEEACAERFKIHQERMESFMRARGAKSRIITETRDETLTRTKEAPFEAMESSDELMRANPSWAESKLNDEVLSSLALS
jgi:hypothetical protein